MGVYYIGNGWIIDDMANDTDGDGVCDKDCIISGSENTFIYGTMTPMDKLLLPIFCMFMLAAGFGSASMDATDMGKAAVAAVSLFEIIDRKPSIDKDAGGDTVKDARAASFQFQNVAFTYPSRKELPIYTDLNVTIEAGQTVAFVGSSGSGKSTAVQLVERFYDPDAGSVKLDGKDFKDLDLNWLRSQIG